MTTYTTVEQLATLPLGTFIAPAGGELGFVAERINPGAWMAIGQGMPYNVQNLLTIAPVWVEVRRQTDWPAVADLDEKLWGALLRAGVDALGDELDAEANGTDGGLADGLMGAANRIREILEGTKPAPVPLCETCGHWRVFTGYGNLDDAGSTLRCGGCSRPTATCTCGNLQGQT